MENKLLAQYYNEQFKQRLDPVFEELGEEDVKRLEKIVRGSVGFDCWKLNRACREVGDAFEETFQKLGILKRW